MNAIKKYYQTRCCAIISGILVPISISSIAYSQSPTAPSQSFVLPAPAANAGQAPRLPNTTPSMPTTNGGKTDARLQIYDVPLDHVGAVSAQLQLQFGADKRVRITNDPATGRLMVLAPDSTQTQIGQAVEAVRKQVGSLNMDARGNVVPSTIQQNQYKLKRATWRELEDAVGRLAGPRLTITTSNNGELAQLKLVGKDVQQEIMLVDRRNDEIRLQGTPANVFAWTQVVTAIDVGQSDPARPTQIIPITPATPERIEKALKLVRLASYQQTVQEDQATGAARITPPGVGDDKATAIGSPDALSAGSGLIGDVDISFVPEMGLVIVKGSKKDVQRVLEVIEQIKKQSVDTAPEIELLALKHVNSQALAAIIKDLNEEVFAKRQGQVSITALGQPNSLLLIGRPEALVGIKDLINKLDQPLDPNSELRIYKFVNSSAVDAEALVKNFFGDAAQTAGQQQPANAAGGTTLLPRVKAVADYRTNSLLVQASPRDQTAVARLVKEIDTESTSAESEIKVFPIKYAIASELEPILKTAITGENTTSTNSGGNNQQQGGNNNSSGSSSRASVPSSRISVIRKGDGEPVDSGLLSGVVVTTNPSINALIVRAPSKSMALIKALIDQLDQPASVDAKIKVFEVKNGDASSLATTLQQAFGLPTTGTNTQQTGNNGLQGLFGLQNQSAISGGAESSLVPLRIATEIRTNSIIVSGSDADLNVMEVLLLRLDEDNARQRTTEVVWLRNSSAVDVANAITNLINTQRTALQQIQPVQQAGQATGQIFSVNERIEREVFVVAEPATNSLIISAMPKYMQMIRQVIERLDRQQPMIAVEILIAEVTLNDSFDFGTEFGLQDALLFDRNSASGGTLTSPGFNQGTAFGTTAATPNKLPQNIAGQGSSGFALGRTNTTLGYGGLVLAAGSQSVNMLFRALQDANRVQILSRPQLMTVDGNIASVQVGSQVPRIGGTTVTTGISQQQVADVPVGLIMQIQPRTNQDGLINMIVAVTRSSLGPTDTGVPIGFAANGDTIRSPIINTTQAQTRVTAYDGQTVVLSGLITKNRTSQSRRIPWLADIPLAGALFRFDSQTESRTELLVVMTPRVINFNDNEKLEMIKQVESSRMSYCLADVLNIHGDVGLSPGNGLWGPAASPIIYPDLQPTVEPSRRGPQNMMQSEPEFLDNNMQMNGDPNSIQDEFPINAPVRSNSNGGKQLIKSGNGNSGQPTVNSASPIQNSSYQPGLQQGAYGVTPASYQPMSQTPARNAPAR